MKMKFRPKAGWAVAAVWSAGLVLSCSDPAHDNSEEPLLGAAMSYNCSVRQGFHFEPEPQGMIGFIFSLNIAGQELIPDFKVTDPESQDSTLDVVGVVSAFYWDGSFRSPVYFSCQVSSQNKNTLSVLTHRTLENTETRLEFIIYDYDPDAHTYYKCLHCGGVQLIGQIEKSRGVLTMAIDLNRSTEVETPPNYNFNMGVEPAEIHQLIFGATAADKKLVKPWGISAGI